MGKPYPMEFRTRVVAYVDEGHGHREAARHFRVSPKFVNELFKLRSETGSLAPRPQGNGGGHGKLAGITDWNVASVTAKGEITLDELVSDVAETHGIDVHRGSVWRVLRGVGLTHKKDLQALEQKRRDVADLRRIWIARRQSFMANHLERLTFVDETSVKTNIAKTTGRQCRSACSIMCRSDTGDPALRHDRLDAPWVIDGAMNAEMFGLYIETQLAPTLREVDVGQSRQPVEPNGTRRSSNPARNRRLAPLLAAIHSRPEPHRDSVLKAQSVDQESRRTDLRSTLG